MATWYGLTGSGYDQIEPFGSEVSLMYVVAYHVTLATNVHISGPTRFPRIHQAGWVGAGYYVSGWTYDEIGWSEFIDHPTRDWWIYPLTVHATHFFYDLQPGEEINLEIVW
jgi:hypothetical protein